MSNRLSDVDDELPPGAVEAPTAPPIVGNMP